MIRHYCCTLLLALGLCAGAKSALADTVRCESQNNGYNACPVDTRGGVSLSRQLSSAGCWQGDTWGYDRNRIWVSNGCRAEFRVGSRSNSSSSDKAVAGAIVLIAAAAMAHNKNKDKDRDRDRYDNRYDDRYDDGGYPQNTFRCESQGQRLSYCRIPGHGHVEIYRQLSSSNCSFGRSWGIDGNQVWVDNGCRADFAVYR